MYVDAINSELGVGSFLAQPFEKILKKSHRSRGLPSSLDPNTWRVPWTLLVQGKVLQLSLAEPGLSLTCICF